jgi:hypothetical protein
MKYILRWLILITGLACSTQQAFSQDCKNALYDAGRLFEAGRMRDCIARLDSCVHELREENELVEAYHLIALSYHVLNEDEKANLYVRKLLVLKPDYQKYPNIDPMDFRKRVNRFKVSPKIYLGLYSGINITSVALIKSYSLFASKQRYQPQMGYGAGFTDDMRIRPLLGITSQLMLSTIFVDHIIENAGGLEQHYSEQQNYYMISASLIKYFTVTRMLTVHAGMGAGAGILGNDNVSLEAIDTKSGNIQQSTKDALTERNGFQPFLLCRIGISYPAGPAVLCLDAAYEHYMRNTVKSSQRMNDIDFIFNNEYINDDIRYRNILISLALKFPVKWSIRLEN